MTGPVQVLAVAQVAAVIRDSIVEHFETVGVEVPPNVFVAAGDPNEVAWDCEQLVVALQGIGWGPAEDVSQQSMQINGMISAMAVRHAVFIIELVRCTPTGTGRNARPSTDVLNTTGEAFMRDSGALSQGLVLACNHIRTLERSAVAQPGLVSPSGPEGGYHGLYGSIAVTVGQLG